MAQAERTKDRADCKAALEPRKARKLEQKIFASKKFADLSKTDKETLLKNVAIKLGMIQPD